MAEYFLETLTWCLTAQHRYARE